MSMQNRNKSRQSYGKKYRKQFSTHNLDQNGHQQMDAPQKSSSTPENIPTKSEECSENAQQIHIIHVSDLTNILNEMISTFEAQSLMSSSPYLCLDMDNIPRLLRHIIEHRCHNVLAKELLPANNVTSDDEGFLYESYEESSEVYWSPRDGQSGHKTFAPGPKCKTKKRCSASISKGEIAALVSRILNRSRNSPKKSFPILNPEDLPDLILKENISPVSSENCICVSDVPKLIGEVMDGEISVPLNDIFIDNLENQDVDHLRETVAQFSPRENNREMMSQRQSILEDCSQLEYEVNKQNAEGSGTSTEDREVEEPCLGQGSTANGERTDMLPESRTVDEHFPPPKPARRQPRVSSIFGDVCCRSAKRYMDPTIASTARATTDDPFYPSSGVAKKHPANGANGISKARAVSAFPTNNDRCVSSGIRTVTSGKLGKRAQRYRLKECIRPWESPFFNPNQLYCLEEVRKESVRETKGEKGLLEDLRTLRPSPRPSATQGDEGKRAQVTRSESSLLEGDRADRDGRSRSEERLIRAAQRLKKAAVPKVTMPDWNSATKCSSRDEVVSLENENGMEIIDKMIKPKKVAKALRAKK